MIKRVQLLDTEFSSALDYLRSDNVSFSPSVLFAFSDVTRQELEEFAGVWTTLSVARRRRVALAMADLAEENIEADFNSLFRYLLDDEDAEVREQAINGLWEDEGVYLIKPLIGFMRSDAAARVRAAAASALGRFVFLTETKRIAPEYGDDIHTALLAVIRNTGEDPLVRRRAIESIAYVGDETVRDIIASAYANDDALMRASAIFAMGRSADPYWRRTIAQELYSQDPQIRFEAARAAGELEYKAAVPRLIELLEDADREVQNAAITSLGQIGGKEAREALEDVIESDDEVARELAQDALDELEFGSGNQMLLYDIGLATDEEAILDEEFGEDLIVDEDDEQDEEE